MVCVIRMSHTVWSLPYNLAWIKNQRFKTILHFFVPRWYVRPILNITGKCLTLIGKLWKFFPQIRGTTQTVLWKFFPYILRKSDFRGTTKTALWKFFPHENPEYLPSNFHETAWVVQYESYSYPRILPISGKYFSFSK